MKRATLIAAALLLAQSAAAAPAPQASSATPKAGTAPKATEPAKAGGKPRASSAKPPEASYAMWPERVGNYHGQINGVAFGGQGEFRFAEDRVRGVSDPEWFSVGRIGGFLSVRVHPRIEFVGEGAWDQGPDDFSLEQLEVRALVRRSLQLHGGVFLVPLGRSNMDVDGPRREFAERSLPATELIGAPNAQLGAGVRGAIGKIHGWPLTWELDVVTGYDDGLIMDAAGGTRVPMGRNNYGDNNGVPALVGRIAAHPTPASEIGLAAESGRYNETVLGGVEIDNPRYVHVVVADATSSISGFGLFGEAAMAIVDVPPGLGTLYAERQWGASLEVTRMLREPILTSWRQTRLVAALRVDAIDLDRAILGDSRMRLTTSLNFRRMPIGVVRVGWYYEIERDRFNNETPKAGLTLSTAAYF